MLADLTHSSRIDASDLPKEDVIFGSTAAMREVRQKIDRAVREDLPVLIQGESGTGKEIIAKYLHIRSAQPGASFIKVNCIAFPAGFLRIELLSEDTEIRSAGTLYLDEISDVDWKLQEELFSLLSKRDVEGYRLVLERAGTRVVFSMRTGGECDGAALDRIPCGEDSLICVQLPPLRKRKQDIPQLCDFLMQKQARRFAKKPHQLTPSTLALLRKCHWPGNLRELENWVARVVILGNQEALAAELQDAALDESANSEERTTDCIADSRSSQALARGAEVEILKALQARGWSRRRAAQELRISYHALVCRLRDAHVPRRRRSHREPPTTP
jgi:two-component system, NtrC family, response regulator AtoC